MQALHNHHGSCTLAYARVTWMSRRSTIHQRHRVTSCVDRGPHDGASATTDLVSAVRVRPAVAVPRRARLALRRPRTRWALPGPAGPQRSALECAHGRRAAGRTRRTAHPRAEVPGQRRPVVSDHLPARSTWDCLACAAPWPCPGAKADLAVEYRHSPTSLSIYLAAQLYEAVGTLTANGDPTPADLYARFLGWARRADW